MRTVKQLAAVTGIDYETVRYYCTPLPKKNEKGENVGRRGAGLVSPVSRKGRWNQYDDKALFDLLLIGLFRKANFHIREIRDVLQGDPENRDKAFELQEERLLREKRGIERRIRLSRALRLWASDEGSEKDRETILAHELMSLGLDEFIESIASTFGDHEGELREGLSDENGPLAKYVEAEREMASLLIKEGDAHEIAKGMEGATARLAESIESGGGSITHEFMGLVELFHKGESPTGVKTQDALERIYQALQRAGNKFERWAVFICYPALSEGGMLATGIELSFGEGIAEYLSMAILKFADEALKEDKEK